MHRAGPQQYQFGGQCEVALNEPPIGKPEAPGSRWRSLTPAYGQTETAIGTAKGAEA